MAVNTIVALRQICETCTTRETDKFIGNQRFEARVLNREESHMARRGILETSEMMSNGLMVAYTGAVDGAEWEWEEILPGVVHSRATGGLSKIECGFDPQALKKKHTIKRQHTERMYIHREECMLTYIGSTLQEGGGNGPIYIRNNDNLITIAESRALVINLMINDMRAMARAVDGNTVLGNWAGDGGTGTIINSRVSRFPHFDGVIKQALLQGTAAYYATVEVTLPSIASGAFFIKWHGQFDSAITTDADDVVAAINLLRVDATGEYLYSATHLGSNVLRITANTVEQEVYGEGALQLYYSSTGSVTDCDDFLTATIVENPMPYAEQPLLFDYTTINETNFYSYFKDVVKEWKRKMVTLFETGKLPETMTAPYIAIDPLLLVEKDFSYLVELVAAENGGIKANMLDSMFPRFVGLKVLEGSGLWFMTFPQNVIYLTNFAADMLGVTKIWHDEDCDLVKSKNEMLGNVLVADFDLFATNAKGSSFESALTDPYQPENLPHLAPDVRSNAISGYSSDVFRASAVVSWTDGTDSANTDLRLQDASSVPAGRTIDTYAWVVYTADNTTGTVQPASQVADVTTTMTDAQFAAIQMVGLTVTLDNGDSDTVYIPNEKFIAG